MQNEQPTGRGDTIRDTAETQYRGESVLLGPYVIRVAQGRLSVRDVRGGMPSIARPAGHAGVIVVSPRHNAG